MLRGHCEDVGRDYDEIAKTVMMPLDPGANGEKADALLEQLRRLAGLGISARLNKDDGYAQTAHVIKAGKPITVTSSDTSLVR